MWVLFLCHHLPCLLRQGFLEVLSLPSRLGWLIGEPQESLSDAPMLAGASHHTPFSLCECWSLNLDLHACTFGQHTSFPLSDLLAPFLIVSWILLWGWKAGQHTILFFWELITYQALVEHSQWWCIYYCFNKWGSGGMNRWNNLINSK